MAPSSHPNIVFVLTDDQGFWALGASGNPEIRTPELDRLARSGIRFENMFCASPVCSPARASILTGRMPSQHGIHDWLRGGNIDPSEAEQAGLETVDQGESRCEYLAGLPGYTDALARIGYTCGLSGKWHLGDSLNPQKGFSYWRVIPGGGSDYQNAPIFQDGRISRQPGYLTDVIGDNAIAFLEEQAGRPGPFYLSVCTTAPHSPWDSNQHPADLRELYRGCAFQSAPDGPAHPLQINSAPRGTGERRRELLTGYYAAISGIDRMVGRIVAWLENRAMLEDTLFIFSSDNGMNMGHHGLWGKGNATFPANMYEESIRVPFIISRPSCIPGGQICANLLSHVDIYPTLLDYLNIPDPETDCLPGRSFAPLLRGESLADQPIFIADEYGPTRMIRTRRWKYIHRYPYGPHELYDLQSDPGETHNRANDPGAAGILNQMRDGLRDWFARNSDPSIDGALEPVTGKGQVSHHTFARDFWYIDANGNRIQNINPNHASSRKL